MKDEYTCCECSHKFIHRFSIPHACPKCKREGTARPNYAASRVKGSSYTPYTDGSDWAELANAAMKEHAQSNFINRK